MKLTATKLPAPANRKWVDYEVTEKGTGKRLGLLTKFKDTRSEKHPWKAYDSVGGFIGAFYHSEGGKRAALNAVAEVAKREGRP